MKLDNQTGFAWTLVIFAFFITFASIYVGFCTQVGCNDPTWLDKGGLVSEDGEPVCPRLPLMLTPGEGVSVKQLMEACEWWNDEVGEMVCLHDTEYTSPNDILVSAGYVGGCTGDLGTPCTAWGSSTISISGTFMQTHEIVISSDIMYNKALSFHTLRHEVGHALSLLDDPGPPATVDLRSVMASPGDPLGRLTAGDLEIVLGCVK